MSVVIIAINTRIVNKVGVMMPCSKPILSKINSIKPRAFINVPMANDWRHDSPAMRADRRQAPPLPTKAIGNQT